MTNTKEDSILSFLRDAQFQKGVSFRANKIRAVRDALKDHSEEWVRHRLLEAGHTRERINDFISAARDLDSEGGERQD